MIVIDNPYKYQSDEWFVYNQLRHLQQIARDGLNPVYATLKDFWYDFWPDFSWREERLNAQVRLLLAHPEFEQLEAALQARFGQSLREELARELPRDTAAA